jgi:hypothetical protein
MMIIPAKVYPTVASTTVMGQQQHHQQQHQTVLYLWNSYPQFILSVKTRNLSGSTKAADERRDE